MSKISNLIRELAEIWEIQSARKKAAKAKYPTEYAFTSGGTKYYQFADITNLPYMRGMQALDVYRELEMRCSREFLQSFYDAGQKILHDQSQIDVYKLNALFEVLNQRLHMATDVDLMYKLASVAFFDEHENPYTYDQAYAEKKIAKWRKDQGVHDFFMQKPLKELTPFLCNAGIDFDIYSKVSEEINALHRSSISTIASMKK